MELCTALTTLATVLSTRLSSLTESKYLYQSPSKFFFKAKYLHQIHMSLYQTWAKFHPTKPRVYFKQTLCSQKLTKLGALSRMGGGGISQHSVPSVAPSTLDWVLFCQYGLLDKQSLALQLLYSFCPRSGKELSLSNLFLLQIIVERGKSEKMLGILDKSKFLVPEELTMSQLTTIIRCV